MDRDDHPLYEIQYSHDMCGAVTKTIVLVAVLVASPILVTQYSLEYVDENNTASVASAGYASAGINALAGIVVSWHGVIKPAREHDLKLLMEIGDLNDMSPSQLSKVIRYAYEDVFLGRVTFTETLLPSGQSVIWATDSDKCVTMIIACHRFTDSMALELTEHRKNKHTLCNMVYAGSASKIAKTRFVNMRTLKDLYKKACESYELRAKIVKFPRHENLALVP